MFIFNTLVPFFTRLCDSAGQTEDHVTQQLHDAFCRQMCYFSKNSNYRLVQNGQGTLYQLSVFGQIT